MSWEATITMTFNTKAEAEQWLADAEEAGIGKNNGELDSTEGPTEW